MDKKIEGGDKISGKSATKKSIELPDSDGEKSFSASTKSTGKTKLPFHCIGDICISEEGEFVITVPEDANPDCSRRIAEMLLKGGTTTTYKLSPKAVMKSKEEIEKD